MIAVIAAAAFGIGIVTGTALGMRVRRHQARTARWQRYLARQHVAATQDACVRALEQLARWRDTYYAARANRRGWPERLP